MTSSLDFLTMTLSILKWQDKTFPMNSCLKAGYVLEEVYGLKRKAGYIDEKNHHRGLHIWNEFDENRDIDLTLCQFNSEKGWDYPEISILPKKSYPFKCDEDLMRSVAVYDGLISAETIRCVQIVRTYAVGMARQKLKQKG